MRVTVPAAPEFRRLADVTAAGLASGLGLSFDQVDALRLAIDEGCFGLVTRPGGQPDTVHLRFLIRDGALEVEDEDH